jgi:glycosyltransferase involved in cell wall biosynthesis
MSSVSVIIPTYNRAHCVGDSIRSALAQTVPPLEVIVVDDGSTDPTKEVVARFGAPVRCICKTNGGVSSARNAGIAAAHGEWIALLDADDLWEPEKLAVQLAVHAALPEAGWSFTDHRTTDLVGNELPGRQGFVRDFPAFDDTGLSPNEYFARTMSRVEVVAAGRQYQVWHGDAYRLLFDGNFVFPSCVMVRREVAARAGPWDESFRVAEDTEWFHRLAAVAPAAVIMSPLMSWRRGQEDTLMHGRNVGPLVENAIASLDRALMLRGEPDARLRALHANSRRRLLRRLAYGRLSVYDRRGARAALRQLRRMGGPWASTDLAVWGLSWLPTSVLHVLHRTKRNLRGATAGTP